MAHPTQMLSIKTASQMLGTVPAEVADLCKSGALPSGRLGERIVIPLDAVQQYAATLLEAS